MSTKTSTTDQEKKELGRMTLLTLLIIIMLAFLGFGCEDKCEEFRSYVTYDPVYETTAALREQVAFIAPEEIHLPGKIYLLGQYLFINEVGKGIHVIDNQDPSRPTPLGFINIPGNYDMAGKGQFLYADSYVDLVVFDISDISDIREVNRVGGVFENYYSTFGYVDASAGILVEYEERLVEEFVDTDCDFNGWAVDESFATSDPGALRNTQVSFLSSSAPTSAGIGGSMARFTVSGDHLYTVDLSTLRTFDISDVDDPVAGVTNEITWGVETIFPYEDKLFLGAQNGMHIFSVSNPNSPAFLSTYEHITSCDPVVVQDDIAYVTLRGGTECNGFTNQLEVIDVANPSSPQLLEVYPMLNPHGLGIDGSCLFVCEGEFGLKMFDAEDITTIDQNLTQHFEGFHAYDVIPIGGLLMLIGNDGLYQYTYDCEVGEIEQLSALPILPL